MIFRPFILFYMHVTTFKASWFIGIKLIPEMAKSKRKTHFPSVNGL